MRHLVRLIPLLLGVAAALLASAAGAASPPSAIGALVEAGKLDEAIATGQAAVAAKPSDPDLRKDLAIALAAKGRTSRRVLATTVDAKDLVAGTVTLARPGPDNPPRIDVRYDPALLEQALDQVRTAIRLAPARKDLRLQECYFLTDAGDVDGAAAAVRSTLAALPHGAELAADLASFGVERARRGDPRGGALLLRPVSAAYPRDASIAADHGYFLAQAGNQAEGIQELERAVKLAPADLRILRRRTTALMLLREFKAARSGWQGASAVSHEDADRLGAAAAAIAFDTKVAKSELRDLATPSASADPALLDLATSLLGAASAGATEKGNVATAKKLADGRQELLALPILHRALKADPQLKEAAALLYGIERAFGFESVSSQVLRDATAPAPDPSTQKPPAGSPSGGQSPGETRR
jgi:tetratricopeptide (TPR) repeat protein